MKGLKYLPLIILVFGLSLPAQARRDPGQNWQVLPIEHFDIIYPASAAQAAARMAEIAEQTFPQVKNLFGYAPPGRTPLVLNPMRDTANGYAQAIYRKMEFYLTVPTVKWYGPNDPAWLETLMLHEYTHLCFGLREEGLTGIATTLFGEVNGTNLIAPRWWVEGLSVYTETELSSGGRGRSPYHRMKQAANLLSDRPWSLGQIDHAPRLDFPADRVYIPGYDILKELQRQTGQEDVWDQLSAGYSAWPFFGLGYVWHDKTGRDPGAIWDQVKADKRREYNDIYGRDRPVLPNTWVLTEGRHAVYGQPKWTADGRVLTYRQSLDQDSALVSLDPKTLVVQVKARPDFPINRYDYSASLDQLVYSRISLDPVYSDNQTSDVYQYTADGKEIRLTRQSRAWSPALHADGRVVFVQNGFGSSQLVVLDPATGALRAISAPAGANYQAPRWSPDGSRLAAAVRINGKQDVCLVDPETGELTPLTGWDAAGDWDPAWSPDGKQVFFVSDRSGVHQIYAYALESHALYQVTDAWLGAFDPDVSPDGLRLALAEYRPGNTQRIVIAPLQPENWTPAQITPQPSLEPDPRFSLPPAQGRGYSAWPYLVPSFWIPMLGQDQDGLLVGMASARQDPLEIHSWWAQGLWQPKSNRLYGEVSYTNLDLPVMLTPRLFSLPRYRYGTVGDLRDESLTWYRAQGVSLEARLPMLWQVAQDRVAGMNLDAVYTRYGVSDYEPGVFPDDAYQGVQAGVQVYAQTRRARDLFPVFGGALSVRGASALPGPTYDGRWVSARGEVYLPSSIPHQAFIVSARGSQSAGLSPEAPASIPPNGYGGGQFNASRSFTLGVGYRFPLTYLDNGPGLVPVYFQALWAELLVERGAGWDGALSAEDWQALAVTSFTAALHLDLDLFWYLPSRLNTEVIFKPQAGQTQFRLDVQVGF